MDILEAINDKQLFRLFLEYNEDVSLKDWNAWRAALACLYGLPVDRKDRQLIQDCTGRQLKELPVDGFQRALFLTGRRSGKSRISALIGGYEALFGGHGRRLAKGETGVLPIVSPTKFQSSIVWRYLSSLFEIPLLAQEVSETQAGSKTIKLKNGIQILILTGDWRTVRGPTVVTAVVDEVCFFGLSEESKVRSDVELVRALRPSLLTTGGRLICISSKYARRGWAYSTWKRYHGSNREEPGFSEAWRTLVWDASSKTMNPRLPQADIDEAFEDDPAAAKSEFGGEWREDVAEFIPRSTVEALVVHGRKELSPQPKTNYRAFVDLSGGRSDSASLAIGHKLPESNMLVVDLLHEWRAPFNPQSVIAEIAAFLRDFKIKNVVGDNYSAEFVSQAFRSYGIRYSKSEKNKSQLYLELLPRLCSGQIELLDSDAVVVQLSGLERRTRSGGRDTIDHPRGGRDDLANAIAGLADMAFNQKIRRCGAMDLKNFGSTNDRAANLAWDIAKRSSGEIRVSQYNTTRT